MTADVSGAMVPPFITQTPVRHTASGSLAPTSTSPLPFVDEDPAKSLRGRSSSSDRISAVLKDRMSAGNNNPKSLKSSSSEKLVLPSSSSAPSLTQKGSLSGSVPDRLAESLGESKAEPRTPVVVKQVRGRRRAGGGSHRPEAGFDLGDLGRLTGPL